MVEQRFVEYVVYVFSVVVCAAELFATVSKLYQNTMCLKRGEAWFLLGG